MGAEVGKEEVFSLGGGRGQAVELYFKKRGCRGRAGGVKKSELGWLNFMEDFQSKSQIFRKMEDFNRERFDLGHSIARTKRAVEIISKLEILALVLTNSLQLLLIYNKTKSSLIF